MTEFNQSNIQYKDLYNQLGMSMKRFGSTSLISLAVNILILIFGPFISLILIIFSSSTYKMITLNSTLIIIGIIWIGISVWKFVTNIQFLGKIKNVEENTKNSDFLECYRGELAHLVFSFITIISFIIMLLIFLFSIGTFSYLLASALISLISSIFKTISSILMSISFERWSENIKIAYYQIPFALSISRGANNMKIGRIIQVFLRFIGIGFIGEIIFCFGLISVGKNINYLFNVLEINQTQPIRGITDNLSTTNNYQAQISPLNPIPNQQNHCPYCGTIVLMKETTYCANCGKKIQ